MTGLRRTLTITMPLLTGTDAAAATGFSPVHLEMGEGLGMTSPKYIDEQALDTYRKAMLAEGWKREYDMINVLRESGIESYALIARASAGLRLLNEEEALKIQQLHRMPDKQDARVERLIELLHDIVSVVCGHVCGRSC